MRPCRWPKGCNQYADTGHAACYYHEKLSDGLFEPRLPRLVPLPFSDEERAIQGVLAVLVAGSNRTLTLRKRVRPS